MHTKLRSAAVEMPVRDQPIDSDIGWRKTPSENIAPNPTHVTTIGDTDDDPAVEELHQIDAPRSPLIIACLRSLCVACLAP